MIRDATLNDAEAVCSIYNPYVLGTVVTFEEAAVTVEEMRARMADVLRSWPWLVVESDGRIAGYAYATKWRARAAYRTSVETTVYLGAGSQRRGVGTELYRTLIDKVRSLGAHRAMGGIALPNDGSVALHEKLGFKKVAHFDEVGRKFDRWIDVGYWQLDL